MVVITAETSLFFMLGLAAVLIIGFVGRAIANKTAVPSRIWLIIFGIIIGPILGFVRYESLVPYLPFVTNLVILLILFNAGLNIKLAKLIHGVPRGLTTSLVNFLIVVLSVGVLMYFLGYSIILSILIGLIVAGVSLSAMSAWGQKNPYEASNKTLLTLESSLSEPLSIILVLILISAILLHNYSFSFVTTSLISRVLPAHY